MQNLKNIIDTKIISIFAITFSCVALYISYSHNYILTYNDAASHLNIARRVIDNLTPGLAQIGTVWLPLPHVFMLPFAWNDFLWHTGFAGSIVSMVAYVVSVVFMFKAIYVITKSNLAAIIGSLVMALNPNFLYLQTTPMTETLLLATFAMTIYFLAKYIMDFEVQSLLFCSIAVTASTLIRYDGWFLFMSLLILLPLWVFALKGRKQAEGTLFLFGMMGGAGIVAWVLWNWAIFKDPLYFITGPFSAYAQQRILKNVGQLPTEGNLFNALYYYFWAMVDNNGIIIFISSVIGSVIVPFILNHKRFLIVYLAAFSPILFNTVALYLGQSAMNVPQAINDPGMFNIRYGLMALPFIALVLGTISSKKPLAFLVVLVFVAQVLIFVRQGVPVALADGLHGLHETYYTVEASKWLSEHYDGGLILTSLASHDAFVARVGIPMKNYVHEGTREYWVNALDGPDENIAYIATLSFPPDLVWKAIGQNPVFWKNYKLVHSYGKFGIYKRIN